MGGCHGPTLRRKPARERALRSVGGRQLAQYAGFSLHAGIGVEAEQRAKLIAVLTRPIGDGRVL
jgi:hypothetical protein